MGKSKVLKFSFSWEQEPLRVRPGSEGLKELSELKHLGSFVSAVSGMEVKLKQKFGERRKII